MTRASGITFITYKKKIGSTQNQHWVNREVVQGPLAQPILESLLLLSARNHPCPRPGHLIRGVGQHSRINVEDNLTPCFQPLSAAAAESLPVELIRSNLQHPSQARLEPIFPEPSPCTSPVGLCTGGSCSALLLCQFLLWLQSKYIGSHNSLDFIVVRVMDITACC